MASELKSAVVTAGARRVGRQLCFHLAKLGYDIALHYNSSKTEAEETKCEIEELGRRCELVQADLRTRDGIESLIPRAQTVLGNLKVLVNNASVWEAGSFSQSSYGELSDNLHIHLYAPYILTRDFSNTVQDGSVINIIDSNITRHNSDKFAYLLTKKALYDFTLMAAAELAPRIRVNAIAPGLVLVPEADKGTAQPGKNPLQRPGSPDDVSKALEFLITHEHLTGQCIYVSGGKHL